MGNKDTEVLTLSPERKDFLEQDVVNNCDLLAKKEIQLTELKQEVGRTQNKLYDAINTYLSELWASNKFASSPITSHELWGMKGDNEVLDKKLFIDQLLAKTKMNILSLFVCALNKLLSEQNMQHIVIDLANTEPSRFHEMEAIAAMIDVIPVECVVKENGETSMHIHLQKK